MNGKNEKGQRREGLCYLNVNRKHGKVQRREDLC